MASARTQILNSMDIGLYSVFGQYDKKLLEDYDLFALDGSMGGGQLNLAKICDNLESYMKPVLKQNSQKLSLEHSGLTGYRLLTDNNGEVFYQQIVQYMQETLGSQGVQALLNRMSDREKKTEEANLKASQAETGGSIDRYDSEMNQASQKSQQAAEEAAKKQQQENASSDQQFGSGDTQTTQPAPAQQNSVNNPITVIKRIMKMGVLELVLPSGMSLVYRGYTKNDEAGNPLLKKLGGKQDFAELAELVSSQGGRYYWYLDPMSANTDQINKRSEAANNLSNMVIRIGRENFALLYRDTYFYRLSEMTRRVEKALNRGYYADAPVFAVNQLSFRLYGDYTRNQEKTRAENLPQFISLVEKLAGGQSIPLYQPNQYLWKYTSEFYNVPLTSSQYLFETDTVPFLQIVLSGHMELFGAPLNTGTYSSERLLRMIEYGISPSFTVTDCPSEDLYKTTQEDFFSTNFDDWEGFITESYSTVQDALQPVRGQAMVSHRALSAGFILTVYDNGTKVYVNYTNETKTDGGVTVEPYGYRVVAG